MRRGKGGFRSLFAVVAVLSIAACAQAPKPTVDLLSKNNEARHVDAIQVEVVGVTESPFLLPKIQQALTKLPAVESPTGRPMKLTVRVTRFNHVTAVQSMLVGGATSIDYNVIISDESKSQTVYEIAYQDGVGYAPGGIIGVIAVLASDEEEQLAAKIAARIRTSILTIHNVPVAKKALNLVIKWPEVPKKKTPESTGN